jgi:protein ImuB
MSSPTPDLFDSLAASSVAHAGLALVPPGPEGAARRRARELWLCVFLPRLPLEALATGEAELDREVCVVEGTGSKQRLAAVSDAAARRGVAPGQGLNAALALWPDLELLDRQPAAEAAMLQRLARWATQFTPLVSPEPPQALLAEVRGSLGLFGGARALRGRAARELEDLGLQAVVTLAPTPRAALWLARAGRDIGVESLDELPTLASRLPLACLDWPPAMTQTLVTLGTRTIADLARLPRDGFARRFGPALLDELDEGFGRRPQPRRRAVLPERFDDNLELPMESASARLIEIALERLLERLQAFLRSRAAGIRGLAIEFRHRSMPVTRLRLGLARPGGDSRHLLVLLRERLSRLPLPAPVLSLRMRSSAITPLDLRPGALAVETGRDVDPEAAARLLERLRARLGGDAVFSVCRVPEHRPELAWRVAEPTLAWPGNAAAVPVASEAVGAAGRRRSRAAGGGPVPEASDWRLSERAQGEPARPPATKDRPGTLRQAHPADAAARLAVEAPLAPRPLWMLADPQRLQDRGGVPWHDGSPLDLASGPERIETGWWDGRDVRRDYYVAAARSGVRLWVYRERTRDGGWWLHGVFG